MAPQKRLALSQAETLPDRLPVQGYEIHMGHTSGPDCDRAWLTLDGRREGAASADGRIRGCYLHGLFTSDRFRAAYLAQLGYGSDLAYEAEVEDTLDALAIHLETHMDLDTIWDLAAKPSV